MTTLGMMKKKSNEPTKTKSKMKKTMRFLSMAALAMVGMVMTGCSSEDDFADIQQPENKSNVVTMTTTVGFDEGVANRALTADGVKTFAAGDQIAVIYKNTSGETVTATSTALTDGDITNEGKNATFTVKLTDPKAGEAVRYIYPAAMISSSVETTSDVDADANVRYDALNAQDGTLSTLASTLDLAIFDGSLTSGAALPASATMTNRLAILACTLKNADGSDEITNTITGMTIGAGTNTYTITRSAAAGPIYVAIRPTDAAAIKITATDGTKHYNKNLTGKTYAAGNGYSVSWKMPEALLSAATTADYGMVVCSKGHLHPAKTAVPSGCTAVGILGKVTETGHGLILALQDATKQQWSTINGWTTVIPTYDNTRLKLLPDDAARGSLTSYTTLGSTMVANWCVAQKSDYEAIFTNLGSTTGGSGGKTFDANVNAYITTGVGGTAMGGGEIMDYWYWSATEAEHDNERGCLFKGNYYWDYYPKANWFSVRPVLAFYPFNHLPLYY